MAQLLAVRGMDLHDFKNKYPYGCYGKDLRNKSNRKGIWNSIEWKKNKMFRERSEVLIIKDNKIFIGQGNRYYSYTVPGGSLEPNIGIVETAIKESQEEARINIKNVKLMDKYEDNRRHDWIIMLNNVPNVSIQYDGTVIYVCVAEYDSRYNGHVSISDFDYNVAQGKFEEIDSVKLRPIHRKALENYLNRRNL